MGELRVVSSQFRAVNHDPKKTASSHLRNLFFFFHLKKKSGSFLVPGRFSQTLYDSSISSGAKLDKFPRTCVTANAMISSVRS